MKILIIILFAVNLFPKIITGSYTLHYDENVSSADAKKRCKNLAIRDAVESFALFIESETKVNDSSINQLIISKSFGLIRDVEVLDHSFDGNKFIVFYKIECHIDEKALFKYLETLENGSRSNSSATTFISQYGVIDNSKNHKLGLNYYSPLKKITEYSRSLYSISYSYINPQNGNPIPQIVISFTNPSNIEKIKFYSISDGYTTTLYSSPFIYTHNKTILDGEESEVNYTIYYNDGTTLEGTTKLHNNLSSETDEIKDENSSTKRIYPLEFIYQYKSFTFILGGLITDKFDYKGMIVGLSKSFPLNNNRSFRFSGEGVYGLFTDDDIKYGRVKTTLSYHHNINSIGLSSSLNFYQNSTPLGIDLYSDITLFDLLTINGSIGYMISLGDKDLNQDLQLIEDHLRYGLGLNFIF